MLVVVRRRLPGPDRVASGRLPRSPIKHQRLQSEYALKVIHPRGPSDVRRLENEGVVQSKLHHPNIAGDGRVEVDGCSACHGVRPGTDLATARKKLGMTEAIDPFDGIARRRPARPRRGLAPRSQARERPAPACARIIPKVSDFGIAKIWRPSPGQTIQGIAMGTPRYMAPEQFTDAASVDQRADLFSLGCLLYELVSGESVLAVEPVRGARLRAPGGVPRARRTCLDAVKFGDRAA
jgi:serine/threonine-protein kinase